MTTERRITITDVKHNGHVPTGELALKEHARVIMRDVRDATTDQATRDLLEYILLEAQSRRISAAYGGAMHDNGASDLESQVEVYVAGLKRVSPSCWEPLVQAFNRDHDPDYAKYLELKKKFGDR